MFSTFQKWKLNPYNLQKWIAAMNVVSVFISERNPYRCVISRHYKYRLWYLRITALTLKRYPENPHRRQNWK